MVLLFASCGLLSFFVVLFWILSFFHSFKTNDKNGHSKTHKSINAEKNWYFFQLAQLCSRIVILFFGDGLKNADYCWKLYKNLGFSIVWKGKKTPKCPKGWVKTWSKVESKLGPSMLRNIIGPSFDTKKGNFVFSLFFWMISPSLQKEEDFWKTKKGQICTKVLTPQRPCLDQVKTLQHIYIYTHIQGVNLRMNTLSYKKFCC